MKILKFGGKSLANGEPLKKAIEIIQNERNNGNITVVVSARGNNTDELVEISRLAFEGKDFATPLQKLISYQKSVAEELNFDFEYSDLFNLLIAIKTLNVYNSSIEAKVIAYGELFSTKIVSHLLQKNGIRTQRIDAREIIKTRLQNGEDLVDNYLSESLTLDKWQSLKEDITPIVTGFIASDTSGQTTTLGRNGSNLTATLLANYLNAEEVQNWTNINGLYTADPNLVSNAQRITALTYKEANELAQFGANILHAKTILPLIPKEIPFRIKNSFSPNQPGTIINSAGLGKGIKAVNVIRDCAIVSVEGKGMLGTVGIDSRIFSALSSQGISIRLISQASSERSIGFVINKKDAIKTVETLEVEFQKEITNGDISSIEQNSDIAVIAITGKHNYALEKAISGLRKNRIWLHLITNSISGNHISLIVSNNDVKKAVNVVHNQVFGAVKKINVVSIGKGTVGKALINQILDTSEKLIAKRKLEIKVVGIVNSKSFYFAENGVDQNWESDLQNSADSNELRNVLNTLRNSNLENVVFIDNTASSSIAESYPEIIEAGFDLIASNKIGNTLPFEKYQYLRDLLESKNRKFYYETNVGAGLPIIDTIKQMVQTDDEINAIKGVFSGSLSYIFNRFSEENKPFSEILKEAREKGYTEPDAREDLGGNDVARKLLILAREIGLYHNLDDIEVVNLIPESLREIKSYTEFANNANELDRYYENIKSRLKPNQVLRYVGEINENAQLSVKLITCDKGSPLANLKGADSLIEIYADSYGDKPIIIQGAGAGAEVTARGVYSDLIRLGNVL